VLARVPVTSMSFVAVRTLSQDNRVETQSQVSDRRDTPQQAIHVLNALFKNRSHVPKNLKESNLVDFHSAADYTPLSRHRDLAFSLRSFRLA